ncbi:MAG: tyrosine-type recombinase/integrase [Spirochaetes bacterium]|nr:tyrosine-type recombinase/integrase [Spirochaetota bacterium]
MILTLYSTGIRASELTHLKVSDIDSKRMQIRIDQGKGGKGRYVRLSEKMLKVLRLYWRSEKHKPETWLFPGREINSHLSRGFVENMIRKARKTSGIQKQVTAQSLRHYVESWIMPGQFWNLSIYIQFYRVELGIIRGSLERPRVDH